MDATSLITLGSQKTTKESDLLAPFHALGGNNFLKKSICNYFWTDLFDIPSNAFFSMLSLS